MYAYENNAIINNKTEYKWKLPIMLQSEMSIQEVVKDCTSFRAADGSNLLHLCFDHCTEYDPDVVF